MMSIEENKQVARRYLDAWAPIRPTPPTRRLEPPFPSRACFPLRSRTDNLSVDGENATNSGFSSSLKWFLRPSDNEKVA